ncbi:MAG: S8 family serine peptidase [bacterium]|nr:S8 family serine peptidase [bacterium]
MNRRSYQRYQYTQVRNFSRFFMVVLFGVVLSGLMTGSSAAQQPSAPVPPQYQPLLDKAQAEGTVRVIVGVRLDQGAYQLDSGLDATSASRQQADIAAAQADLLADLPRTSYDAASVTRFQTIPFAAVTVDEAGLRALIASGEVTSISEDLQYVLNLASATSAIGAPAAWSAGFDGTGWTVAVLDSGVDRNHPFLAGKVVAEACFSFTGTVGSSQLTSHCPNGQNEQIGTGAARPCTGLACEHGTHVAGIAAGSGSSFSGVAKGANIIAVQVASRPAGCGFLIPCTTILLSSVVEGLEWVYGLRTTHNIAAVNLSLGSTIVFPRYCDGLVPAEDLMIQNLRSAGIVTIAGSGNGDAMGVGYSTGISHPACVSSTISVGAVNDAGVIGSFSNSASILDLLAPGVGITSSVPGTGYQSLDGTSMATPMVSGAWAVLKQAVPTATIEQILTALQSTGVVITDPRNGVRTPYIRVNLALTALQAGVPSRARVLINEVRTEGTAAVELFNSETTPATLTGWRLQLYGSGGALEREFTFPTFTLPAGGYVQLLQGTGTNTNTQLYLGNFTSTLNAGGAARLSNGAVAIDFARWGTSTVAPDVGTAWTGSTPAVPNAGQTLGRDALSSDINDGSDFTAMPPTLGAVNTPLRPANDHVANAVALTTLPFTATYNTRNATTETGELASTCHPAPSNTVWYRYAATSAEAVQVSTAGSDYDTMVTVYRATTPTPTEVACNEDASSTTGTSRIAFLPEAGQTYLIGIARSVGIAAGILNVSITTGGANDDFNTATTVNALPYTVQQETTEATTAGDDPQPTCLTISTFTIPPTKTVWYRYTAPGAGSVTITTEGSQNGYDTLLAVYTGSRGSLSQVACNDNIGANYSNVASRVQLNVTAGTTYHVMVSDGAIGGLYGGTGGTLRLNISGTVTQPPTEPIVLSAPTGTITSGYGNPTYTWNDNGSDTYDFSLWSSASGSPVMQYGVTGLTDDQTCNGTTCTFEPTTLNESARLYDGVYQVYLRGVLNGVEGNAAGPFSVTLDAPPPAPAALAAPTATNTLRPGFSWSLTGDAAFASGFRVYLIQKSLFDSGTLTPALDDTFTRAEVCGSTSSTACALQTPLDLQNGVAYYFFLQSSGPGGVSVGGQYNNGWSGVEFTIALPVPQVVQGVTVTPHQGRPTISWTDDPLADWYYVYVHNNTTNGLAYLEWHEQGAVCASNACTITDESMILGNGSYSAYVYACGAGGCSTGGPYANGWGGGGTNGSWTYNYTPPDLVPLNSMNASYASGSVTVSWQGVPRASWYYVWIGTTNAATTNYLQWHSSNALNCPNMGTCTANIPLALPAGEYYLAVQSAGPGGFSSGGLVNNGFQVRTTPFTTP